MNTEDMFFLEVIFVGRVQGVGFRWTTKNLADGFEVTGYVKNLPNGTVEMVAEGYFGLGPVSEKFIARAGDLVILPYAGESVWWWGGGDYENKFYGNHGGLTAEEMETPLLSCELGF